jgi:hypothetical protein
MGQFQALRLRLHQDPRHRAAHRSKSKQGNAQRMQSELRIASMIPDAPHPISFPIRTGTTSCNMVCRCGASSPSSSFSSSALALSRPLAQPTTTRVCRLAAVVTARTTARCPRPCAHGCFARSPAPHPLPHLRIARCIPALHELHRRRRMRSPPPRLHHSYSQSRSNWRPPAVKPCVPRLA